MISGRILDGNRDPIAGIAVEILMLAHDLRGRGEWRVIESAVTDGKGEYRVGGLPADEYYVRATRKPSRGSSALLNSADMLMTYFPGTLDARTAATIQLHAGCYGALSILKCGSWSLFAICIRRYQHVVRLNGTAICID